MRRRISLHLFVLCLLAHGLPASAVVEQGASPQPVNPDRFLFKGRLAGIDVTTKVEPKRQVIMLVFVVDSAIALGPRDESRGQGLVRVVTDWPVGDLTALAAENYVQTINAMLQDGVRLGECFLVTMHHPGAYGRELLAIEAATEASTRRFLAENREFILNSQWFYERIAMRAKMSRLGTVQHEIQRLAVDLKSFPADSPASKSLAAHIESQVTAGLAERERYVREVASTIDALKQEQSQLTDPLEARYVGYQIADAEQTLADLKAFALVAKP